MWISRWLQEIGSQFSEFDAPLHHTNDGNEMAEDVGWAKQRFDEGARHKAQGTRRQDGRMAFPRADRWDAVERASLALPASICPARQRIIPRATEHSRWSSRADRRICKRKCSCWIVPKAPRPEPRRATGE
jgi:hypothetical protein